MKTYTLKSTIKINHPIENVFPFFDKAENLEKLTPKSVGFKILTPNITMAHGSIIDYVIHIFGLPQRWTTIIQNYDPPHQFVDIQLKGPYSLWHHTHQFTPEGKNTIMTDTVVYAMPFGILGKLIHGIIVKRELRKIFTHRLHSLSKEFSVDNSSFTLCIT